MKKIDWKVVGIFVLGIPAIILLSIIQVLLVDEVDEIS